MTIKSFEDMEIWQLARSLCKKIYSITKYERFNRDFELVKQITRSAGSCMDNIAEGFEREGNKEFGQMLAIAKGSIGETRSQLYRAFDRDYLDEIAFEELSSTCLELSKNISGLMKYLRESEFKGNKFKNK